jgi:tRNA nucleotidyltransferase (CCA-adding enzyme)
VNVAEPVDPLLTALAAAVPPGVREVCETLERAGHEAVTVGGAVRDAMLGRDAGDWDVATSARPEQVVALFEKTIPTGMQHGTVTVVVGRGRAREAIEVTTYRGEGAYVDGRRPTSVVFGVPLTEDLARRDLVVNAIAYDPVRGVLFDPFDGRGDIAARRLRAVGDATARFTEDGLRVMRAIRFAATLGFALDPETEAAIPAALPSLAKVSRERVKVELDKTLLAPAPAAALEIARRTGVLAQELPEAIAQEGAWAARLAWVDGLPRDVGLRAAALLSGGPDSAAEACWKRLKGPNDERDRVVRLVRVAHAAAPPLDERGVRRLLAGVGRARGEDCVALWSARPDAPAELVALARTILDRGDALAAGDLAITGAVVMQELGIPPSREVGRLLEVALDAALDDPSVNDRERLLALVRASRP